MTALPGTIGRRLLHNNLTWRIRTVPAVDRGIRRRVFPRDLRRFNDVLSGTALSGRFWVWGGMLLGWAREGRLLGSDLDDADFAVLAEDEELLLDAVGALEDAGFRRAFRFRDNDGRVTEYTFVRHEAKFEFFLFFPGTDGAARHYFVYSESPNGLLQLECKLDPQPLRSFDFLGRKWLKAKDHEKELEAIYGDWRAPNSTWSALDDRAIVSRDPWRSTDATWN